MQRFFMVLRLNISGLKPALLLFLALVVVGCGGGGNSEGTMEQSSEAETTAPGEVALETEAVSPEDVEITPGITVDDQSVEGTSIIIDSIQTPANGWIVIHADVNGEAGEVLAQEQVFIGLNPRIFVDLGTAPTPGTKLIAMLHTDAGTEGTFEFPGADEPVKNGEEIVMATFTIEAP